MSRLSSLLAPLVLGAAGVGAALVPGTAQAQSSNDLIRILVDASDVIFRSGTPYYRHGDYGQDDRLIVGRDRYGRPVYYRNGYRSQPPYGVAHGYHRNRGYAQPRTRCDSRGRCTTTFYDPRQDRRGYYDNRYYDHRYDNRYSYHDRRWRDDDDD